MAMVRIIKAECYVMFSGDKGKLINCIVVLENQKRQISYGKTCMLIVNCITAFSFSQVQASILLYSHIKCVSFLLYPNHFKPNSTVCFFSELIVEIT